MWVGELIFSIVVPHIEFQDRPRREKRGHMVLVDVVVVPVELEVDKTVKLKFSEPAVN